MGGSGGSEKINKIVRDRLHELLSRFQVIHICGQGNVEPGINKAGYVQYEYVSDELANIFAITDFVVSRAGSNAIFEFLALRIPMLLIPLSLQASRGDQIVNAESFKKSGYAHVLEEADLTKETFMQEIDQLEKYGGILVDHMKSYQSEEARDRVIEIIKSVQKE